MKKQILLLSALTLLIGNIALAQGNWVSADQNVSPSAILSSSGTLSISGSYTWVSNVIYTNDNYMATLTFALPPSVYPSTGVPSLIDANTNTPVAGVNFTNTGRAWNCEFAPGTTFTPGTKLIFTIGNMEIKDDQAYSNQKASHFVSFLSSPANESLADNAASSTFQTIVSGPLPVGLLNFDARLLDKGPSAKVDVNWTTTSEINADRFIIERSKDALEWTEVGSVKAKGNTNTNTDYQSFDNTPLMGKSYYRLKQVDNDNSFAYSTVRVVENGMDGSINIFPNPASERVNVQLNLEKSATIEIKLLAVDGRVVKSVIQKTTGGTNVIEVNISELANGVYEVNVFKNAELLNTTKLQKN